MEEGGRESGWGEAERQLRAGRWRRPLGPPLSASQLDSLQQPARQPALDPTSRDGPTHSLGSVSSTTHTSPSVQSMGTARSTVQLPSTSLSPTRHSFWPNLQR